MALQLSATNGGAIVDATDSFDMMDKLIDFIDGTTAGETGKLLAVGERWTVLEDDSVSVAGERHVFLEGPGLAGTDNIYVNIRIYSDTPSNLHNWQIIGATGYSSGADIYNQPGGCDVETYFTLNNASMPFWFIVNGRRIMIVAQTAGSVSYACYLGWYLPYATPAEFPYPMFNGGNTCISTYNYLQTNYRLGNFYDPVFNFISGVGNQSDAAGQLRQMDGSWLPIGNFEETTSATRPARQGNRQCYMWPQARRSQEHDLKLIQNLDSTFPLLPFIPYTEEDGGDVFGELDGVLMSPLGTLGKKFPDTITVGGDTYLVVNNTYRTLEANAAFLLK